jgi:hypothetical protein
MLRKFTLIICLLFILPVIAACDWIKSEPQTRFQIFYSPHAARDTFLLDTTTGRVWQLTSFSDLTGQPSAWDLMTRIDSNEDLDKFIQAFWRTEIL